MGDSGNGTPKPSVEDQLAEMKVLMQAMQGSLANQQRRVSLSSSSRSSRTSSSFSSDRADYRRGESRRYSRRSSSRNDSRLRSRRRRRSRSESSWESERGRHKRSRIRDLRADPRAKGTRSANSDPPSKELKQPEDVVIADSLDAEQRKDAPRDTVTAEMAALLGDEKATLAVGPNSNTFLVDIWGKILQQGLPKDKKDEIVNDFPPPANFPLLNAPVLNPEMKAIMENAAIKGDTFRKMAQGQLGTLITILSRTLSEVMELSVKAKESPEEAQLNVDSLIGSLGAAGRLAADLFNIMSKSRKYYVAQCRDLSRPAKSLIEESVADGFLLGETFGEKMRAAKASEKAGKEMLNVTSKPSNAKPSFKQKDPRGRDNNRDLNSRAPPKKYPKSTRGGGASRKRSRSRGRSRDRRSRNTRR